jgi:hypothetical protein
MCLKTVSSYSVPLVFPVTMLSERFRLLWGKDCIRKTVFNIAIHPRKRPPTNTVKSVYQVCMMILEGKITLSA